MNDPLVLRSIDACQPSSSATALLARNLGMRATVDDRSLGRLSRSGGRRQLGWPPWHTALGDDPRFTRRSCYTEFVVRRNVTITLDEDTARWARMEAAKHETSVSRLVGDLLGRHMRAELEYETAMTAYMERQPLQLQRSMSRYPRRDEVHDRADLR